MGTNTLTNRVDGQVVNQTFFNEIHQALNGTFIPRNASGVATDVGGDLGSSTYRWNDSYILRMFFGAIASGLSIEDDAGDIVFKRNSIEVGRFTVNGLDASDLVSASVTQTQMANNSIGTNQIINANVTNAKMAANSVDTTQIVDNAVTTNKINALAVTTSKINTDAVDSTKIADNAVNIEHFNTVGVSSQSVSASAVGPSSTTTVASTSFNITRTGRFISVKLVASTTTNCGIAFSSASTIAGNVIFRVDSTTIANQRVTLSSTGITLPASCFEFTYSPSGTGSKTFDVQFATDSNTTMTATGLFLFVYQY